MNSEHKKNIIRIGTRGSLLALQQTQGIADRIAARHPDLAIEIVTIKTTGDKMQDVALAKIGGKGVFVKEIEDAMLRGEIDLAVHSLKDVPSEIPEGLCIGAVPEREDARDVLISREGRTLEAMPKGAQIATGSLRRGIQLKHRYPDCEVVSIRGNLDTRIKKLETQGLDGVILAAAGLARLGWTERISQFIAEEIMIPAIGQGALALEIRKDDYDIQQKIAFLNHEESAVAVEAERAFLKVFGGGCQLPIAAHAKVCGGYLSLTGLIGSPDASTVIRSEESGSTAECIQIGERLGKRLLEQGGREILEKIVQSSGF